MYSQRIRLSISIDLAIQLVNFYRFHRLNTSGFKQLYSTVSLEDELEEQSVHVLYNITFVIRVA